MPHLPIYQVYVYSADDFVGGLPAEAGAAAAGRGPFEITLKADAEPTLIEITDDDLIFDEVDSSQKLTSDVALDGLKVASGTSINSAYDLINTADGHKITSFHFGGSGYQQGDVDGIVSTEPMAAGETFVFNLERTSHRKANAYQDYVACFAKGTGIATPTGETPIEDLQAGDLISTLANGPQPLAWVGSRVTAGFGAHAPVALPKGWNGLTHDLLVSRQHRMLLTGPLFDLVAETPAAFVTAAHLLDAGVGRAAPICEIEYHHLLLDKHEVILANGSPSESLLLTPASAAVFGLSPPAETNPMEVSYPVLDRHAAKYAVFAALGYKHPQPLGHIGSDGQAQARFVAGAKRCDNQAMV